ncbi:MAG: hypothetical protein GY710_04070 [Desulfobacteraceae bacterium]|nr:hypothetical protein [Desulfobacteraceae bacterium]
MKIEFLLKIGGVYNLLCALLHLVFPKMFGWKEILLLLPGDKRPFLEQPLYIMNWCMGIFWIIFAYICFVHSSDLLKPGIGRTLLVSMVTFWIIRIFVLQPVYIGLCAPISWQMIGFFMVGLILFAVPLIKSLRSHQ